MIALFCICKLLCRFLSTAYVDNIVKAYNFKGLSQKGWYPENVPWGYNDVSGFFQPRRIGEI